jgi:hypothetical protein
MRKHLLSALAASEAAQSHQLSQWNAALGQGVSFLQAAKCVIWLLPEPRCNATQDDLVLPLEQPGSWLISSCADARQHCCELCVGHDDCLCQCLVLIACGSKGTN